MKRVCAMCTLQWHELNLLDLQGTRGLPWIPRLWRLADSLIHAACRVPFLASLPFMRQPDRQLIQFQVPLYKPGSRRLNCLINKNGTEMEVERENLLQWFSNRFNLFPEFCNFEALNLFYWASIRLSSKSTPTSVVLAEERQLPTESGQMQGRRIHSLSEDVELHGEFSPNRRFELAQASFRSVLRTG